ncbi:MAG: M20/M25/M40 family metallo-hydrolase, partial [Alphaproteobacteria bacterium]|nr:M20/M25/M40 family metallo-hydrolase [Alphaproteobacteria bacterium]
MPIVNRIAEFQEQMTAWRRELHMYPETAFEEVRTSAFVADRLGEFGMDAVHTGIAKTGVVGVLRGQGGSSRSIAIRADMDALDIEEANDFDYKSRNPGKMHACGHEGHPTRLLGAAKTLAETRI